MAPADMRSEHFTCDLLNSRSPTIYLFSAEGGHYAGEQRPERHRGEAEVLVIHPQGEPPQHRHLPGGRLQVRDDEMETPSLLLESSMIHC